MLNLAPTCEFHWPRLLFRYMSSTEFIGHGPLRGRTNNSHLIVPSCGLNFIGDENGSFISTTKTRNCTASHEIFSTFIGLIADFMSD